MVLGPDEPFAADIATTCREFADRTRDYWMEWVRRLSIAYDWQEAIIRAAITLKLSNFEETGGIVAALTTSIPEAPGSGRTWDYRYCWLRDAYFVVKALNRLGATKTMEGFHLLHSRHRLGRSDAAGLQRRAVRSDGRDRSLRISRAIENDGPVRVGNAAARSNPARHVRQHHSRRHAVCSSTEGCRGRGMKGLFHLLETLGTRRPSSPSRPTPASGNIAAAATFTPIPPQCAGPAAAAWRRSPPISACATARPIGRTIADKIQTTLLEQAWSEKRGSFTAGFGIEDLDASVLLLPEIGLIEPNDPRFVQTVAAIERELLRGKHVMRYASADDFGMPEAAFLTCRFWLIDAWWWLGRREEARDLFVDALAATAIATACWLRTSIRRPVSSGAISRKPIRWRA